jgi:uncharacterized protein (DUF433 family)
LALRLIIVDIIKVFRSNNLLWSRRDSATIKALNLEVLMTLAIVAEAAPLQANEDGVILVGKTRVTLDTVVAVFNQGATAEEIAYRYPSLSLADIYATIAFYLKHQPEVEAYLQQRQQRSQEIRAVNQARFDPQGLRDRLLTRKAAQEAC